MFNVYVYGGIVSIQCIKCIQWSPDCPQFYSRVSSQHDDCLTFSSHRALDNRLRKVTSVLITSVLIITENTQPWVTSWLADRDSRMPNRRTQTLPGLQPQDKARGRVLQSVEEDLYKRGQAESPRIVNIQDALNYLGPSFGSLTGGSLGDIFIFNGVLWAIGFLKNGYNPLC